MTTLRENVGPATARKGWAGALVTIASWALPAYTVVDPPAYVWTAVLTLIVWAVPNSDSPADLGTLSGWSP